VNQLYTQRYVDSELENNITAMKQIVGGMDPTFNCTGLTMAQHFDNVQFWKVR